MRGNKTKVLLSLLLAAMCILLFKSSHADGSFKMWPTPPDVPSHKTWTIKFNFPIDPDFRNNPNSVYVLDSNGGRMAVRAELADNRTVRLSPPANGYLPGRKYSLYIADIFSADRSSRLKNNIRMDFYIQQNATPGVLRIPRLNQKSIQIAPAKFRVFRGEITKKDQTDQYEFIPEVSGKYRFEFSDIPKGSVNISVLNGKGDSVNYTSYGVGNGEGLTVNNMNAGEAYSVRVKHYRSFNPYTLTVGCQKETANISGYTSIDDSIEFKDQRNVYEFTPPVSGKYRFQFENIAKGAIEVEVYDGKGERVGYSGYSGLGNREGFSVRDIRAGELYEIRIFQVKEKNVAYRMNIGYQKPTADISAYSTIKDSVEYHEQRNVYTFTPSETGQYRFEFSDIPKGSLEFYVYNGKGDRVGSGGFSGLGNLEGVTVENMNAGETYEVIIIQRDQFFDYTMKIIH